MAYQTKGLTAMQVYGKDNEVVTLKERTRKQVYEYLQTYMTYDEVKNCEYIEGSQHVSENNGYTYAEFKVHNNSNDKVYSSILCVHDNPELN